MVPLAAVKPRVYSSETGEIVPIDAEVRSFLKPGARGAIRIFGPTGSGKTTALEYLAGVLPACAEVRCLDEPSFEAVAHASAHGVVVYASPQAHGVCHLATLNLAGWSDDDLAEYLLARHPVQCSSVMARVRKVADRVRLEGCPELWCVVLDQFARDDSLFDPRLALERFVRVRCGRRASRAAISEVCLGRLTRSTGIESLNRAMAAHQLDGKLLRLARHPWAQVTLAARRVVQHLRRVHPCTYLKNRLPIELVREVAAHVAGDRRALDALRGFVCGSRQDFHAMTASILHAAEIGWRPESGRPRELAGGWFDRAQWSGVSLAQSNLSYAELDRADLSGACLDSACLRGARLHGANLTKASLRSASFIDAKLSGADLAEANATAAKFDDANLSGARLEGAQLVAASMRRASLRSAKLARAQLSRVDFTGADLAEADLTEARLDGAMLANQDLRETRLDGAVLNDADLTRCNLEYLCLARVNFENSDLHGALLTGSRLVDANLLEADLRQSGLADIDWEEADLRDADLRGATFQAGSSRSGLVGSPIACEGSRTGFYTDDYADQEFKNPEEVRKANLCGADLRGANIEGVDFYLVDLRGARYDRDQEDHFRRCGAILED